MSLIEAFEKSMIEYEGIQKSKHWKKYNARRHLYTLANLENFRNNQLSEGLDPTFTPEIQKEIYDQLVSEVGDRYVHRNLTAKNIGNGRNNFIQNGLVVDGGQNYEINWLHDLEESVFVENKVSIVCEIGGGYGSFAQKIRSRLGCKIILIDLPEANILSSYYLSKYFPEASFLLCDEIEDKIISRDSIEKYDFIIIPPWYKLADDIVIDMFINTRSMMEMNIGVIKRYFSLIQSHAKEGTFFLNLNRYEKISVGYPIQLSKYPYDQMWDVVLSKSAWRQKSHHFLLTRRTSSPGNIFKELVRIDKLGAEFILKPKTLAGKFFWSIKNMINPVLYQYFGRK